MSNINYVIREEEGSNLISAESEFDFIVLEEILEDYPYILDSMKKEEYYFENDFCSFFDELIFENKVVGFAAFEVRNENHLMLTECYILPEFRGNRLFFDEICKMIFVGPNFGILQPTRNIVELLIDYAFAKNVTEDIVVSAIDFHFDEFDAKSTKNRELDEDEMDPSNFYDLSINSTVFVDGDEVIYHDLLENDFIKNGPRDELTDEYFNNLIDFFSKNEDELNDLIVELKEELPQVDFGFNEVVGNGEGLTEFMQSMVDDDLISYGEALKIKEQLTDDYHAGEIDDDTVTERLISLIYRQQFPFSDFDEFKEIINLDENDDEDRSVIRDFVNIIGDNSELGNDVLEAVLNDNGEDFERLIVSKMADDENFLNNFLDLANEYGEDDEMFLDDFSLNLFGGNFGLKYKLDDTEYGKDYPISHDQDIYTVLDSLNDDYDYQVIMDFIQLETAPNTQLLTDLLLISDLIQKEEIEVDWPNCAFEFKKSELQDILRENNLKVTGNKSELLERLAENNVKFGETFKITSKGKTYLEEFAWINYYWRFLNVFDFNDFYKYLENHEGKLKDVSLSYLEEHMKLANENDDKNYLESCLFAKKAILDEGDQFISDLNILE